MVRCRAGIPGAVTPNGQIRPDVIQKALPPLIIDGTAIPVTAGQIQESLIKSGLAVRDKVSGQLVSPKTHAERETQRAAELAAAEQRFRQWCDAAVAMLDAQRDIWLAGSGVPESELMNTALSTSQQQKDFVRRWAKEAKFVHWQERGVSFRGSTEAKAQAQKRIAHAEWLHFLTQHNSSVEATEAAWQRFGLPGELPYKLFYAPMDSFPVFLDSAHAASCRFVTLATAKLHRKPPGVQQVATLQEEAGFHFHRHTPLFRAEDVQPYSTELLVSDVAPIEPIRIQPLRPREVTLHIGPTNSGKTHAALRRLMSAERGAYLAPLRLLAWEAYERLNATGCPTNLLTGEESLDTPGATVTAATVEMLHETAYDVVVIDEAQSIADPGRGWAWARALARVDTDKLEVCTAPEATDFLYQMLTGWGDQVNVVHHERLVPLVPESKPVTVRDLPPRSAVIAFSRTAVLRWKTAIEKAHPGSLCAVIYGALPPDIRRAQTELVLSGQAKYVVATDAIGMGLNLPLDHVFFSEAEKFDGENRRPLTPAEVRQIAGRAGRYGLASGGTFGGVGGNVHRKIIKLAAAEPHSVRKGTWQPTLADLDHWPWRLGAQIRAWQVAVAPHLPESLRPAPLKDMRQLADQLPPKVEKADRERAFRLITAPVSRDTLPYWDAVVQRKALLKAPTPFNGRILDDATLQLAERSLHEHDLCQWLARHRLFIRLPDLNAVRRERDRIARAIHEALKSKNAFGCCRECGAPIPPTSHHGICEDCYRGRREWEKWRRTAWIQGEDEEE